MKQKIEQSIKQLNQILFDIYENEYLCNEHLNNLNKYYLDYCFFTENKNVNNYKISIHLNSKLPSNSDAYMQQNDIDNYEVFFPSVSQIEKNYSYPNVYELTILQLIFAGHEYKHLLQYINNSKILNKNNNLKCSIEDFLIYSSVDNLGKKNKKKFFHSGINYCDNFNFLCETEIEADEFSFYKLTELLTNIKERSLNLLYKAFLDDCIKYVKKVRTLRRMEYNKSRKPLTQNKKIFENLCSQINSEETF